MSASDSASSSPPPPHRQRLYKIVTSNRGQSSVVFSHNGVRVLSTPTHGFSDCAIGGGGAAAITAQQQDFVVSIMGSNNTNYSYRVTGPPSTLYPIRLSEQSQEVTDLADVASLGQDFHLFGVPDHHGDGTMTPASVWNFTIVAGGVANEVPAPVIIDLPTA